MRTLSSAVPMAKEAPVYDLTLLLSFNAEEDQRKKILSEVESAISTAGGSIERDDDWGRRPLSYEIRHQTEAEYHLLQFRAPATLIEELSHTLRITDGVLRHRVIKVRPGTPPAPSTPPPVVATATPTSASGGSSASAAASATTQSDAADAAPEAAAPAPAAPEAAAPAPEAAPTASGPDALTPDAPAPEEPPAGTPDAPEPNDEAADES